MVEIKYEPHVDDHDESPQPPVYSAQPEAALPPYGSQGAVGALQPGPQFQPHGVPCAMGVPQPVPQYQPFLQQPYQPTTAVVIRNTHIIPPPSYMVRSILSLFFFWPLGIVAIIKSSEVNNLIAMGDFARASVVSREARNWNIAAVVSCTATISLAFGVPLILGMIAGATEAAEGEHNF